MGFPVYRLDKEESIGKNGKENFELVSAGEVKEDADNVHLHGVSWKSATACKIKPASFSCFAPRRLLLLSS